jgi:hypothetical protein
VLSAGTIMSAGARDAAEFVCGGVFLAEQQYIISTSLVHH